MYDHVCTYAPVYTCSIFRACPREMTTSFEAFNQFRLQLSHAKKIKISARSVVSNFKNSGF